MIPNEIQVLKWLLGALFFDSKRHMIECILSDSKIAQLINLGDRIAFAMYFTVSKIRVFQKDYVVVNLLSILMKILILNF